LKGFKRQALHAGYLELVHPFTRDLMNWEVDIPEDFLLLIEAMENELELFGRDDI